MLPQPYLRCLCKKPETVGWKTFLGVSPGRQLRQSISQHATTWKIVHPGVVSVLNLLKCAFIYFLGKRNAIFFQMHMWGRISRKYSEAHKNGWIWHFTRGKLYYYYYKDVTLFAFLGNDFVNPILLSSLIQWSCPALHQQFHPMINLIPVFPSCGC